jgi:AAA family ATP:ADP antiporter
MGLIGIWLLISWLIYKEYVNSFRQAIAHRQIDAGAINVAIKDDQTVRVLLKNLNSSNERHIVYALQLLESVDGIELTSHLSKLLRHSSDEVREKTLKLLNEQENISLKKQIEPLLADKSETVRREAVRYFVRTLGDNADATLKAWLHGNNQDLRGATLHYIAGQPELAAALLTMDDIRRFMKGDTQTRAHVADALGVLDDPKYHPYLQELLTAPEPEVKLRAITNAGRVRAAAFIPLLVRNLTDRIYRRAAREALASYGSAIVAELAQMMTDESLAVQIRLNIPRVLGLIPEQASVDALLTQLEFEDERFRLPVVKALSHLRLNHQGLKFDARADEALNEEIRKYYRILSVLHVTRNKNGSDTTYPLLAKALHERLEDYLERIFHLLELLYPPRDIDNAYAATHSRNQDDRANAIEFLDNILSREHKQLLLPIMDRLPVEQILQNASFLPEIGFRTEDDALADLLAGPDTWLKTCTLYEIGKTDQVTEFRARIIEAGKSEVQIVRETAELILH